MLASLAVQAVSCADAASVRSVERAVPDYFVRQGIFHARVVETIGGAFEVVQSFADTDREVHTADKDALCVEDSACPVDRELCTAAAFLAAVQSNLARGSLY